MGGAVCLDVGHPRFSGVVSTVTSHVSIDETPTSTLDTGPRKLLSVFGYRSGLASVRVPVAPQAFALVDSSRMTKPERAKVVAHGGEAHALSVHEPIAEALGKRAEDPRSARARRVMSSKVPSARLP